MSYAGNGFLKRGAVLSLILGSAVLFFAGCDSLLSPVLYKNVKISGEEIFAKINEFNRRHFPDLPLIKTKEARFQVLDSKSAKNYLVEIKSGEKRCLFSKTGKFLSYENEEDPGKLQEAQPAGRWSDEKAVALGSEFLMGWDPVKAGEVDLKNPRISHPTEGGSEWMLTWPRKTATGIVYAQDNLSLILSESKGLRSFYCNYYSEAQEFPPPQLSKEQAEDSLRKQKADLWKRSTVLHRVQAYGMGNSPGEAVLKIVDRNHLFSTDPLFTLPANRSDREPLLAWAVDWLLQPAVQGMDELKVVVWIDARTGDLLGGELPENLMKAWTLSEAEPDRKPWQPVDSSEKLYDDSADARKQISAALVIAKKEHRRVLVQIGSNQCGWCHRLHKFLAVHPATNSRLRASYETVLLAVVDKNLPLLAEWGNPQANGIPVIVILNEKGKQLVTQDTGELEEGKTYDLAKVVSFLDKWAL